MINDLILLTLILFFGSILFFGWQLTRSVDRSDEEEDFDIPIIGDEWSNR